MARWRPADRKAVRTEDSAAGGGSSTSALRAFRGRCGVVLGDDEVLGYALREREARDTSERVVLMLSLNEVDALSESGIFDARFLSSDLCGLDGHIGAVFGGGILEELLLGVVGRDTDGGREICKGLVGIPDADIIGADIFEVPFVTDGERPRRVGNGGARDMTVAAKVVDGVWWCLRIRTDSITDQNSMLEKHQWIKKNNGGHDSNKRRYY